MRCVDVSDEPSASARSIQSTRLHGATFQKVGILLSLACLTSPGKREKRAKCRTSLLHTAGVILNEFFALTTLRHKKSECTGLVKIMLTLMDCFSPADRRTPWVTD